MKEQELKELFYKTLSERGISNQIGVNRSVVSKWKKDVTPTFGLMLEVLYRLGRINITENATGATKP
jgi:transposase